MNLRNIKNLFKKDHLRPSKKLGQNFLVNKKILRKIVKIADIQPQDVVLEIGPGPGNLTMELAKLAKKIIAVEKDSKLCEILKKNLKNFNNVEIIQADILKIQNSKFKNYKPYKVVANLPYYIVAPVIRKFLEAKFQPELMVLMVQKEVAQRICALPPKMNLLAVSVQFYAQPKIISYVSRKFFWPQPKVDAAIIKILNLKSQILKTNKNLFFKIVKAGFSQPRKQLANNIGKILKLDKEEVKTWLWKNNIQPSQRAETLRIQEWIKLANTFRHFFLFLFYYIIFLR